MTVDKNRNLFIQISRIFACFMVFMVHFGQRVQLSGRLRRITDLGQYGVQLFFIISGFLAALSISSDKRIINYYKKRAISILPLYYIVIIFFFIYENILNMYYSQIPIDTMHLGWFRYIFLLNGFVNSDTYFWSNLGITWTIPIFAFFYFIIPWIMKMNKNIITSFVMLVLSFLLCTYGIKIYNCTIIENLYYFFIGVFIYSCFSNRKMIYASLVMFLFLILKIQLGGIYYGEIFAIIVSLFINIKLQLPNIIHKIINILDEYSYTFYLAHGIIFCAFIDRFVMFKLKVSYIFIGLFAVIGSILLTIIIHKYIEKPLQVWLKKKYLN